MQRVHKSSMLNLISLEIREFWLIAFYLEKKSGLQTIGVLFLNLGTWPSLGYKALPNLSAMHQSPNWRSEDAPAHTQFRTVRGVGCDVKCFFFKQKYTIAVTCEMMEVNEKERRFITITFHWIETTALNRFAGCAMPEVLDPQNEPTKTWVHTIHTRYLWHPLIGSWYRQRVIAPSWM